MLRGRERKRERKRQRDRESTQHQSRSLMCVSLFLSLHVVIASTHCFDKTLMNTLIQDNVNPIEKVERSSLIVASTIHHTSPAALIAPEQLERLSTYSPMLIANTSEADE